MPCTHLWAFSLSLVKMIPVSSLTMQFQLHILHQQLKKYNRIFNKNSVLDSPDTARKQYASYIELSRHGQLKHGNNSFCFWKKYSSEFPPLALLAKPEFSKLGPVTTAQGVRESFKKCVLNNSTYV